ncbi:unnamed protein product, partial [marine sediment metagenome]
VPWGTHLCQFYHTKRDLIDILVPYFKAGLENNEFCMWITAEPLGVEEAKASLKKKVRNLDDYIKKGQIEILEYSQWYIKSGKFDSDSVLQGWVEKEEQALKKGFNGLRLTGNTFWLEKKDWKDFTEYEAAVDSVIGNYRMIAICSYSLEKCGASNVIDVVSNHKYSLIRKEGKWELVESAARIQAEEEFKDIFNLSPDMVAVYTTEGKFLKVNPTWEKVLGYTQKELLDLGWTKLVHPDDVEKTNKEVE